LFIDNIRVFLTILVILHHLMVIYTASGSWIYTEQRQDGLAALVGNWFCGINQSYFMGLFLFISAYFVPRAYDRKGAKRFLVDRFLRLGIPLVLYGWFIRPLWIFLTFPKSESFWNWYSVQYFKNYGIIGGGPLWFIEVLLIFAMVYVLYRATFARDIVNPNPIASFPKNWSIILCAFLLGIITFIVRIWFPQNTTISELNLQLANFSQYILLFVLGLVAYSRNWLLSLPEKLARGWMYTALWLSVLPALVGFNFSPFPVENGWPWFQLISACWEAYMCFAMCISVIYLFQRYADRQGAVSVFLSNNAYGAYLIHELVITSLAIVVAGITFHPLLKFALMGLSAVPLTFSLSALIRKIPLVDWVL